METDGRLFSFSTNLFSRKFCKYFGEEHGWFAASKMQQLRRMVKERNVIP